MKKLDIIYEDKNMIAINKEAGMLTIADNKNHKNIYHEEREYIKKQNTHNKIFIVHRLDKDTSGIVLFAKTEKIKTELQSNWNKVIREYYAIVEGVPKKKKDKLINYLAETKDLFVYVTNDSKKGKKAITDYKVIKSKGKYSLLKINIETGRKNQIRVQLSNMGHPIVGDKKYNSKTNPINRIGLHASKIVIEYNGKTLELNSKLPSKFDNLMSL